ncbi:DUF559 domain-containing protein [Balneolaceae bacterium YR4-1]|uniref:DUF559 domain-containing protein n=1 Tax=Halalkalibaculum roseum TaxID=2709311 RepID=A0A6M1SRE4_9BACT|nr:endonuclease domain-containing protein [Halalkalibaculum roseum]NGP75390.1 DUF559 domain-containing protein [Halalkalibaculum roseum]
MKKQFNHFGYNKKLKALARNLRNNSTKAEIRLWSEVLRARKMKGYTFLRQRPVLNYISDFMCKELKLIIEVDGVTHNYEKQWYKDKQRQKELEEHGFTVLRFSDDDIQKNLQGVYKDLERWIESHPPAPPSKGDYQSPQINPEN